MLSTHRNIITLCISLSLALSAGSLRASPPEGIVSAPSVTKSKSRAEAKERINEIQRLISIGAIPEKSSMPKFNESDIEKVGAKDSIKSKGIEGGKGNTGKKNHKRIRGKMKNNFSSNQDRAFTNSSLNYYSSSYTSTYALPISQYTSYPNRTVGKLYLFGNDEFLGTCSGSSIGANHVLTAGHCIRNPDTSTWTDEAFFSPAYYYGTNSDYGFFEGTGFWTTQDWANNFDACRDYGYMRVGNNDEGNNFSQENGYLGWSYNASRNQDWEIRGYPGSPWNGEEMVATDADTDQSNVRIHCYNSSNPDQITVSSGLAKGASGGPWIVNNKANGALSLGSGNTIVSPYLDTQIHNHLLWLRQQ